LALQRSLIDGTVTIPNLFEGAPVADQCLSMVCRKQKAMTPMMALEAECGKNEPMQNWRGRISINPAVCHGRACVRGTRVLVSVIVDNVAAGVPHEEILQSYPALTRPDIDAALAYAAELTREGTVDLPLEIKA